MARRQTRLAMLLGLLPLLLGAGLFHRHEKGTPPPGTPRVIPHTHDRAGDPLGLRHHLEPTVVPGGMGYYVGGGNAFGGSPRACHEGTWGWDDTGGHVLPRRVRLGWSHGQRYQGGTGAYRTDVDR